MVPRKLWRMLERGCDRCTVPVPWLVPAHVDLVDSDATKVVGQNDRTSISRFSVRLMHLDRIAIINDGLKNDPFVGEI
jgi:hypothetical protein